jgi:hypothetical protein
MTAGMFVAALAVPAAQAADVQFPTGSSIGLDPPPGLTLGFTPQPPGFYDADSKVSIVLLELPPGVYLQVESSMTTAAAKEQGILVDRREIMFTDAGPALVSAGEDTRQQARKWMLAAQLPHATAVVSVQIPEAARQRYPDDAVRAALASLTTRTVPAEEQLSLLPYRIEDLAGFRLIRVVNRSTAILTDGPRDDMRAVDQPHIVIGIAPSIAGQSSDRERLAHAAFNGLAGFAERRITTSEMLRLDGQPVHEIRAEARDATSGAPVSVVQWLRFGQNAYLHIVAVTKRDNWARDFPKFRAVRDGIQPRR